MSCQRVVVAVVDGRRVLQLSAAAARGAIPIDCQSEDFVRVVRVRVASTPPSTPSTDPTSSAPTGSAPTGRCAAAAR
jgi:hypothetical protein